MKLKGLAVCLGLIPCIFLMHGFTAYAQEGGSQTVLFAEDDQSDYVGISIDGSLQTHFSKQGKPFRCCNIFPPEEKQI
ncbi:hypothetical protein Osc1_00560 [Hominimerdicola sp. 21CYCFAH17_S]